MNRSDFLKNSILTGSLLTLVPASTLLQSCEYKPHKRTELSKADIPYLNDIADTIIPTTLNSVGAKAANVGAYIYIMAKDCLPEDEQTVLLNGLNELDDYCAKRFSKPFGSLDAAQKLDIVNTIQLQSFAFEQEQKNTDKPLPHYFMILRAFTINGYFSSEVGMTQARAYFPIPGRFEPCVVYNEGDKVWAI